MTSIYDDVNTALTYVSSDCPRNEWFKYLCAIHDALGQDGYQIALDWSKQSPKFNQKDFDAAWSSIKPGAITKATLFEKAYQNGMPRPDKSDFSTKKESDLSHSQDEPPAFDGPPLDVYDNDPCLLERTENDFSESLSPNPNQSIPTGQNVQNSTSDEVNRNHVQNQWNSLKPFVSHQYLDRKKLTGKLNGYESTLRVGTDKSIGGFFFAYPIVDLENRKFQGFNKVAKEGKDGKKLAYRTKKSGNAGIIGNLDSSTAIICITEGFADGLHIHNAIGHTTLIANDAGNLSNVSKEVRRLYPQCKIVVCADNDTTGIEGTEKAVKAVGNSNIVVAYPVNKDFSDDVLAGLNIADSIEKAIQSSNTTESTKKESDKSDKLSENLIAQLIARRHGNKLTYDIDACEWRSYKDNVWQVVKPAKVQQAIQETLNKEFSNDYKLTFVKGVYGLLSGYVSQSQWDCKLDSVPFQNGVLNLKTKKFLPHDYKHYFTWQLPYAYDPAATCEPILTWLREVAGSEQVVQLIRAFFNAALVGRAYLQRYFELVGPGGTGKGTVIRLLVSMLGNRNCYSTDLKRLEDNRFETAAAYGKRLLMVTDAGGYAGEANVFKAVTGQDWLRKESKNKQQGDNYIFQGMVIIAANQTIVFKDLSSAISRRRITIQFNRVVAPSEKRDLDKEFEPFIPGLLNWALSMPTEQVESLLRDTDNQVALLLDAKKQTYIEGNSIIAWLHACVEYAPGNRINIGVLSVGKEENGHEVDKYENANKWLYPSYARYCVQTGSKPTSSKSFSTRLLDVLNNTLGLSSISCGRGYITQSTRGAYFEGLKLSSELEPTESIVDFALSPKKKASL